jgi:predicted peptidase|tara:strand:- start:5700 stop:6488 length:789 start_codon:yes stop_codon:yes gene_type:complete
MKITRSLIYLSLSILPFQLSPLWADTNFQPKQFKSDIDGNLNYRIYIPTDIADNKVYPLIVFLHGAGERGSNNTSQLTHGVRSILDYSKASNEPAIIIAAQVPTGEQWVNTSWNEDSHVMPKAPSRSMTLLVSLIKKIITNNPIDEDRIYVTGLSMGGFGTWDIVQRMPNFFAAAIPVCGGGDTREAESIKQVPIWAFHGDSDIVVKTQRSRDMIDALQAVGGEPKYTEYEGVEHDSWTMTYTDKNVLSWLFSQKKHPYKVD